MVDCHQDLIVTGLRVYRALKISQIISQAAIIQGLDVKTAEFAHVPLMDNEVAHIRIGKEIYSPLVLKRKGDILICFEPLLAVEAVREYLLPQGIVIINTQSVLPSCKLSGEIISLFEQLARRVVKLEGLRLAKEAGGIHQSSFVMLGVLDRLNVLPICSMNINKAVDHIVDKENKENCLRAIDLGRSVLAKCQQ